MAGIGYDWQSGIRWLGLIGGPVAASACFLLVPDSYHGAAGAEVVFSVAGRQTLAVMAWMAVWWVSEAVSISVTSLLPLVLFPLLGVGTMKSTATPYAHPLIFLFMGGFLIAIAMQRWGLDRRIALLTLRLAGTRPPNMVAGFMVTTAGLSAFVSNTARTAMMVPIAISVIQLVRHPADPGADQPTSASNNLPICLLLGIAYAASIGGIATIIGTPPNALLVAFLSDSISEAYRVNITFDRWLLVGLPVALILLPLTWLLLTRVLFPLSSRPVAGGRELIRSELQRLGPMSRGERTTLAVFLATACCWVFRPILVQWTWHFGGSELAPFSGLTDSGIAMSGAMLLFVIPVDMGKAQFTLDWPSARKLPWGILILFGGGLSLASAVKTNGVAEFIGSHAHFFAGMAPWVIVLVVTATVIFLTELTSNSATTATLLPVLAALAPGLGLHPFELVIPATVAASCAFMMPVATPPNAIVFGSGEIRIQYMMKAGIWLNLIGIGIITALTMSLYVRLFAL